MEPIYRIGLISDLERSDIKREVQKRATRMVKSGKKFCYVQRKIIFFRITNFKEPQNTWGYDRGSLYKILNGLYDFSVVPILMRNQVV